MALDRLALACLGGAGALIAIGVAVLAIAEAPILGGHLVGGGLGLLLGWHARGEVIRPWAARLESDAFERGRQNASAYRAARDKARSRNSYTDRLWIPIDPEDEQLIDEFLRQHRERNEPDGEAL